MNQKKIISISLLLFIITILVVSVVATELLSSQIYFSVFVGVPIGFLSAIVVFIVSLTILKKTSMK
ncbi:MAG: hypothetical protein R6V50_03675 [Thermoplasmatota archaeon]